LSIKDFVDAMDRRHPLALEDALYKVILEALQEHDCVVVDDFHLPLSVMDGCNHYPRSGYVESPLSVIAAYAVEAGKKLIVGTDGRLSSPLADRCFGTGIPDFTPEDYEHLCRSFLDCGDVDLDFEKIYRFAPNLDAHQLKQSCVWCQRNQSLTTEEFIEYLRSQHLVSNVALGEVANVSLEELQGVDDVIESLRANIVVPLENDELANELSLRPKRGVLLVGPPGTGKTTVGRALAHRLKGKFFLIDGTFISGTHNFYGRIARVFHAAKENAPAVIFVDDSDVIFESGQEHGLYRYLLTMLDGLESKSVGRVCVILTAMDVGNLPPALIRSGRIELWLEMRLPDESARARILRQQMADLPAPLHEVDIDSIVKLTDDFTGADLKRTVEDAKALYAYDRVLQNEAKTSEVYYGDAARTVSACKARYAAAESRANASRPSRPVWFNPNSA